MERKGKRIEDREREKSYKSINIGRHLLLSLLWDFILSLCTCWAPQRGRPGLLTLVSPGPGNNGFSSYVCGINKQDFIIIN